MAFVSLLDVSLNAEDEENIRKKGFLQIPLNLNEGAGGNKIYLWYKKGEKAITKIQISFNDEMAAGLTRSGYIKINKNLNAGAPGNAIYLWSYQGSGEYDTPIVDIDVTTDISQEAEKFEYRWKRLACNLNRSGKGAWVRIWEKREKQTYICDIKATDSYGPDRDLLVDGFMRADETTDTTEGKASAFIWYRETTDPKRALTELKVSNAVDEITAYQNQGLRAVGVNLNEDKAGHPVQLWYKKGGSNNPIKAIALVLNDDLIKKYEEAGLKVIQKDLNPGNKCYTLYLAVYQ